MKIIVALDDRDGMTFNKRRQSQDSVLRDKILELSKDTILWVNAYTRKQFQLVKDTNSSGAQQAEQMGAQQAELVGAQQAEPVGGQHAEPVGTQQAESADVLEMDWIRQDEQFLFKAQPGEYCFVEDQSLQEVSDQIEEIVIFRWNRSYPGDRFLDVKPEQKGFTCQCVEEFMGSSHEKITMEIWR